MVVVLLMNGSEYLYVLMSLVMKERFMKSVSVLFVGSAGSVRKPACCGAKGPWDLDGDKGAEISIVNFPLT